MSTQSLTRNRIYRRYKKLLTSIESLQKENIITKEAFMKFQAQIDTLYMAWRDARKREEGAGKAGRPKLAPQTENYCKQCGRITRPGMVYCSRDCAPLGNYGLMIK
jgi:hypothetical protein